MSIEDYMKKNDTSSKTTYMRNLFSRVFLCVCFSLITLIICNISETSKEFIKSNIFETNFKFSSINNLYNKYLLNKEDEKDALVSDNIEFEYTNKEKYFDGVKLSVNENYPVKLLSSGIVVFIGKKDNYGNTIIVQQSNGVDAWYGNISNENVKLYDYIEKDKIIGEASKELYLVFEKNGEFQDYNEFIK